MRRLFSGILKHPRIVLAVFALLAIAGVILMQTVNVNYDLSDYLPKEAQSTKALKVMEESFGGALPNLTVCAKDVSVTEALAIKEALKKIDGVSAVMWLDDVADVRVPVEMLDDITKNAWYKDGAAKFMLTGDMDDCVNIADKARAAAGENSLLSGELFNQATVRGVSMGEIGKIMLYVVPLVLIVLLFATGSYLEPLLFAVTIGIAILLNEGTNALIGDVSYVTQATGAILQLAVSMDYAVFLLNRYQALRDEGLPLGEAMLGAMTDSFSTILGSAMTTVFGFLSLALMRFRMGPDMGIVLAKGVLLSFLSVMILLPVLAMLSSKALDKTRHRSFMPKFKRFARFATRVCIPLFAVVALFLVPCFLAQGQNSFVYGSSGMHDADSRVATEAASINEIFGREEQMALIIPSGDIQKEKRLSDALSELPRITSVTGYATTVGVQIPKEMLGEKELSNFDGGEYSRLILSAATNDEGEAAFETVTNVRDTAKSIYGDDYLLVGQSVVNYDLMTTITGDYWTVNLGAMLSVGLVLMLLFKSVTLPLILLLTIEGAIWLNLSLPYFMGEQLNYIGYQIISAVQLGATVDYGILLSKRYLEHRKTLDKRSAIQLALSENAGSILTPALILTIAGFSLSIISSNGVISQLGLVLGRGAIISAAMVLLFLPALLRIFDGVFTKKRNVIREANKNEAA